MWIWQSFKVSKYNAITPSLCNAAATLLFEQDGIIEQRILIWAEYLNICSFNAMFVWDCVLCCFRSTECRAAVNRCWVMLPPACVIFKRTPFPAESVNHLHSSLAFSSQSLRQDNSQTKHIITHTHTHNPFHHLLQITTHIMSKQHQIKPWF